jgi:hypothetical protein
VEALKIIGYISLTYIGLGLIFFGFTLLYAAIHHIKLPATEYVWALIGAILFWPKLLKEFIIER